ncbi:hypothetical protein L9F63_023430, partial [Diploptera punctata]
NVHLPRHIIQSSQTIQGPDFEPHDPQSTPFDSRNSFKRDRTLEVFRHNPADGSIAPPAPRPSSITVPTTCIIKNIQNDNINKGSKRRTAEGSSIKKLGFGKCLQTVGIPLHLQEIRMSANHVHEFHANEIWQVNEDINKLGLSSIVSVTRRKNYEALFVPKRDIAVSRVLFLHKHDC